MSTASTDAPPKAEASTMSRVGTGGTVVSAVALAVPLGYVAYAGANTVTLNSASSVQNTLLAGIIFTGVAALVALIATVLNLPTLLKEPSAGRIVSTGVSVIVLVASVLFLVLNLVPRVSPLNHLSNDLQPFGNALTKDCSDPLNQLTRDEHTVYLDAQVSQTGDASGDGNFVKLLSVDIPKIQADTKAISDGINQLNLLTVPDPKYQDLVKRCIADEKSDIDFLTNDTGANAIPVPAPFNVVQKTVSFTTLLNDAAGILSGAVAIPGVPLAAIPVWHVPDFRCGGVDRQSGARRPDGQVGALRQGPAVVGGRQPALQRCGVDLDDEYRAAEAGCERHRRREHAGAELLPAGLAKGRLSSPLPKDRGMKALSPVGDEWPWFPTLHQPGRIE